VAPVFEVPGHGVAHDPEADEGDFGHFGESLVGFD
jgi:hypothetical protein